MIFINNYIEAVTKQLDGAEFSSFFVTLLPPHKTHQNCKCADRINSMYVQTTNDCDLLQAYQ
jgi:hypothetical protein